MAVCRGNIAAAILCVAMMTSCTAAAGSQCDDADAASASCGARGSPRIGNAMLQTGDAQGRVPEKVSFLDDEEVEEGSRGHAHHGHSHDHVHGHSHADHAHGRAKTRTAPLKVKVTVLESDMAGLQSNITTLETAVGIEAEPSVAPEAAGAAPGDAAAAAAAEAGAAAAIAVAGLPSRHQGYALLATEQEPEAADGTLKVRVMKLENFLSDARSRVMSINNEVLGGQAASLLATGTVRAAGNGAFSKTSVRNNLRERVNSMEDWVDHLKEQVAIVQRDVLG